MYGCSNQHQDSLLREFVVLFICYFSSKNPYLSTYEALKPGKETVDGGSIADCL